MMEMEYWMGNRSVDWTKYQTQIKNIHNKFKHKQGDFMGWVDWPINIEDTLIQDIIDTANEIKQKSTVVVVVGIGGSYLGAKACIELLQSPFYNDTYAKRHKLPNIYFAGHHLSAVYYQELFERLENEEICLCVISKSGTTLEPSVSFDLLKNYLVKRYGHFEAVKRIYCITDRQKGVLRVESDHEGYKTFSIPDDIGGRYSVLTPVGLLPIAIAGIDIRKIIQGARRAFITCDNSDIKTNICYQYALLRFLLQEYGKNVEIFEVYEGRLRYFTEWLKQLFGESECKKGKGLLPISMQMSTDLHSLGQFLQDGRQIFFETTITIRDIPNDINLENKDITGKIRSMHKLNLLVEESARRAHLKNNTPNIRLSIKELSSESFGFMVYFFERACATSCYLTGVNPFDQPGVEEYKKNIKYNLYSM